MAGVLLIISGDRRSDEARIARGQGPRVDYLELAKLLNADVFDFGSVRTRLLGKGLASLIGHGPAHALMSATRLGHYDVVFSDSEHVGLFVGILLSLRAKRPRNVVLAHHLTPRKKHAFVQLARRGIDTFILHSPAQRRFALSRLGVATSQVQVLPYQVDTEFWRPIEIEPEAMIATAGLECRDYDVLLKAVDGLPVKVEIAAASHWSRKRNSLRGRILPSQITVDTYDYESLRLMYGRSKFVVVPLLDVDFQAGITTILEAMAMAKAVIATKTRGQIDAVRGPLWSANQTRWPTSTSLEESTGIQVLPGDQSALRSAMCFLLKNPAISARLGKNGRKRAEEEFTLGQFVQRFASAILAADTTAKSLPSRA